MEKIQELNKKGVEFTWLDEHTEGFEKVKQHLMETTKIATWDKDLPLRLWAYAAKTGGSGMFSPSQMARENISYTATPQA